MNEVTCDFRFVICDEFQYTQGNFLHSFLQFSFLHRSPLQSQIYNRKSNE